MGRIVSALLLLFASVAAPAADEQWYSVHLDGRKIGHMHSERALEADGRVRHAQRMALRLERSGTALEISTDERSWESAAGEPLAFETRINTAGSEVTMRGEVRNGELHVRTTQQGRTQQQTLRWPDGAMLTEGQHLAAERAGYAPGARHSVLAFDPGSLQAMRIDTRVDPVEQVEIHGRREALLPLQQTLHMGDVQTPTRSWVTADTHALRRMRMPAIGLELEVLACDRACALAPVQPVDVLSSTIVASPQALTPRQLGQPLRYRLRLAKGDGSALDQPPGQEIEVLDAGREFELIVDPRGDRAPRPQPGDLAPNRWLQSDSDEVIALATQAARGARGDAARVEQLERFVRGYIRIKSLNVGYASAREIIAGREGDCTEHAVLLAAMIRALGIPARVATGLAYAPSFEGRRDVFVPHAWVQAWVDDEWRGFDAALARHDAGHIAFTVGDGDPFRFYGGIELLGGVEVLAVERARGVARGGER